MPTWKTSSDIQYEVKKSFTAAFGKTPLRERLQDILGEAIELSRFTDISNLKEEVGDLIASAIQLCEECDWNFEDRVADTLAKIERRKLQYLSLGRKQKIALLGGAFNPPTFGHIKLAQFVLNSSKTFDQAWLVPCYQHMNNKEMVSPEHRLNMCEIAISADKRIKVFDYEIRNQLRGETYNFIKRLQDEQFAKDEYDFSVIIGLDNANTFNKWVNYELLERMIRFVVVSRKGVERDPNVDWYLKPPHIFLATENDIPETSSTQAREILSSDNTPMAIKAAATKWLDPKVLDYIINNNLYANKGETV